LKANREFAECVVGYEGNISEEMQAILFDPQTAGGLLISVDERSAPRLTKALNDAEIAAVEIGEVLPYGKPLIAVS
jgi:selenide,water dikinase